MLTFSIATESQRQLDKKDGGGEGAGRGSNKEEKEDTRKGYVRSNNNEIENKIRL